MDGHVAAARLLHDIHNEAFRLKRTMGVTPGLTAIRVGDRPDSQRYVAKKQAAAEAAGFHSHVIHLPENVEEDKLIAVIDELNADDCCHGILVQLPLPEHISARRVIRRLEFPKDVDGFHPFNVGCLAMSQTGDVAPWEMEHNDLVIEPTDGLVRSAPASPGQTASPLHVLTKSRPVACTAQAVVGLLNYYNVNIKGKHAVVLGRSNIAGMPITLHLMNAGATVTNCLPDAPHARDVCLQADILVVALGRALWLHGDWIKPGAAVVDVGINYVREPDTQARRLVGDVHFESALPKVSAITPVPRGVGPMTVAMLLRNTLRNAAQQAKHATGGTVLDQPSPVDRSRRPTVLPTDLKLSTKKEP